MVSVWLRSVEMGYSAGSHVVDEAYKDANVREWLAEHKAQRMATYNFMATLDRSLEMTCGTRLLELVTRSLWDFVPPRGPDLWGLFLLGGLT